MLVLLTKLLLAPACVAGASLASRRWGPRVGGLIGGLPVVGGPILLVVALQHGREFGAESAASALAGMLALSAFVATYGRLAPRLSPIACVVAGWTAFLAVVGLLSPVDLPRGVAGVAACATFALVMKLLPHAGAGEEPPAPPAWDIPARMAAACALVVIISAASSSLGSHVTGLLAPFPIITAVLAGFTHATAGVPAVIALLRGFLTGFYAYAAFNLAVSLALPDWSIGAAFGVAVVVTAIVQVVVVGALSLRRSTVAA